MKNGAVLDIRIFKLLAQNFISCNNSILELYVNEELSLES